MVPLRSTADSATGEDIPHSPQPSLFVHLKGGEVQLVLDKTTEAPRISPATACGQTYLH